MSTINDRTMRHKKIMIVITLQALYANQWFLRQNPAYADVVREKLRTGFKDHIGRTPFDYVCGLFLVELFN